MAVDGANTFPWPPVLLVLAAIVAVGLQHYLPLNWPGLDDYPAHLVGLAIGAVGIFLIAWSLFELRKHKTTFRPDRASNSLVTTGPYAFFRNPIYLGDTMLLLLGAELTKNIWFVALAAVFAIVVTLVQILPEERHLESRFGEDYINYKSRTRRWI